MLLVTWYYKCRMSSVLLHHASVKTSLVPRFLLKIYFFLYRKDTTFWVRNIPQFQWNSRHILQYNVSQFLSWEFPVFCAKKLLHFFYIKITTFHFENLPHLASKFCYILLRSYKQFCAKILVQLRLKIYDIMMKNYCILSQRVNYTFLCIKWYRDKHNHLRRSTCCSFYL